jgi:pyrroline-5-carboxylate reductase
MEEALAALGSLRGRVEPATSIVFTAADLSLERAREAVGGGPALFRVIANPSGGSRDGLILLCPEQGTEESAISPLAELLACVGWVEVLPEDMLEAANAVVSSSLGFLALALEGVEDGAVSAGLPRVTARAFARQAALAGALLLRDRFGSPADLKDQVASPGGTTIAGLAVLEERAVRGAALRAVESAAQGDKGA